MFAIAGKIVGPDESFTDAAGNQYPAGWLRLAGAREKVAAGVRDVVYVDQAPPGADIAYTRTETFDGDHTVHAIYTRRPNAQIVPVILKRIEGRRNACALGVKAAIAGEERWFDNTEAARIRYIGMMLMVMAGQFPAEQEFFSIDGATVKLTPADPPAIFAAAIAKEQRLFAAEMTHRAGVTAAARPELYDWSAGWPEAYEARA